ncbi:CoA transferase [Microtetraspora sp. AC03309]|uniref:CaiB/BaiF CoA transferase family protein n=1 Tax=Microtetraspora sp. AC03309 TaxID=2779376 RepID=UPI001E3D4A38|nr:CaiB/BaiF CoA-transferase family protein [Microtetraspora sp. AC03309]MCC5576342.1 CoA transferase [Microtetraspora sp. AC03309]
MTGGPLQGIRVIELAGLGPVPFAAMMMADLGADVIRVDRVASSSAPEKRVPRHHLNPINRGRRSVRLDLKSASGRSELSRLLEQADVLLDPYRPGVLERMGIDPAKLTEEFPRLVVARMTGWGQDGPISTAAGHDINFISLSGVLDSIGTSETGPVPPLMYLADFAGGGMVLGFGVLAALVERGESGRGQIIDCSMLEGASLLTIAIRGMKARGDWNLARGTNAYDSGSHFYGVYETSDGKYMAVGAIEPQFYRSFLEALGLVPDDLPRQYDSAAWPELKRTVAEIFRSRPRAHWEKVFGELDACVTPVRDLDEATTDPQMVARGAFVELAGVVQPAPVPKFSRSTARLTLPPPYPGEHTEEILRPAGSR